MWMHFDVHEAGNSTGACRAVVTIFVVVSVVSVVVVGLVVETLVAIVR